MFLTFVVSIGKICDKSLQSDTIRPEFITIYQASCFNNNHKKTSSEITTVVNNRNKIIKQNKAIVFFKLTIKKGDISLLADLKIITAMLQQNAADRADISPKYE